MLDNETELDFPLPIGHSGKAAPKNSSEING